MLVKVRGCMWTRRRMQLQQRQHQLLPPCQLHSQTGKQTMEETNSENSNRGRSHSPSQQNNPHKEWPQTLVKKNKRHPQLQLQWQHQQQQQQQQQHHQARHQPRCKAPQQKQTQKLRGAPSVGRRSWQQCCQGPRPKHWRRFTKSERWPGQPETLRKRGLQRRLERPSKGRRRRTTHSPMKVFQQVLRLQVSPQVSPFGSRCSTWPLPPNSRTPRPSKGPPGPRARWRRASLSLWRTAAAPTSSSWRCRRPLAVPNSYWPLARENPLPLRPASRLPFAPPCPAQEAVLVLPLQPPPEALARSVQPGLRGRSRLAPIGLRPLLLCRTASCASG
mmetsp:Transcript_33923/g.72302  ORF Transcript_33923/g.72302 Transcript_33923/m.72302 type:complete len:332 (+) Transcript_33923:317-1312(+)